MAKKLTKEELRGPDAFISFADRVAESLKDHLRTILVVAVVLLIGGLVYVGTNMLNKHKEAEAQAKLYAIESDYRKLEQKLLDELNPPKDKEDKEVKDPQKALEEALAEQKEIPKSPESLNKNFKEIVERYRQLIAAEMGTTAAVVGTMNLADLQTEYKDYAAARETLQSILPELKPEEFFYGLIQLQLGTINSQLGDNQAALENYGNVVDVSAQEHLHADALLKMALLQEDAGHLEEAKKLYQRVSEEYSTSAAAANARSYLRLLTLKGPAPADKNPETTTEENSSVQPKEAAGNKEG